MGKIGGTSLKTARAIRQVARILKERPMRVVVVSAVGGITNRLVSFCQAPPSQRHALLEEILDIHLALVQTLELSLEDTVRHALKTLEVLLLKSPLCGNESDKILSVGEDLSSAIVHAFLLRQNVQATRVDARDFIITDDRFDKATPSTASTKEHIKKLPPGLCIMQGFIGSTHDQETTTLGRGGGDYSAALIAEALMAEKLLIYTDVPGVYTADPNIVRGARPIKELNLQELAEMANFGSKIVHPATLEPCIRAKIPIHIFSTFAPEKPGTRVSVLKHTQGRHRVRAITLRSAQALITIKSLKMLDTYGFLARIFSLLAQHKISVDLITTSEISVALTIDGTSTGSCHVNSLLNNKALIGSLEEVATVMVEEDYTLLAVVGSGLTGGNMIQKILGIVKEKRVRGVCYGASHSNISLLVPKEEAAQMARRLHEALIEKNETTHLP